MKLFLKWWPVLAIFAITVVFFYPVWIQGKVPLPADALVGAHVPWTELKWEKFPAGVPIKNLEITDAISQFYPWRSFVGKSWREGEVPLWNPYMFSGAPFLATWHSAALYPLNVLYLFLNDIDAWNALLFLQIFLAGIFMYLFLRGLHLNKEASLLGAIAFSFSGYMIAWLEFATGGQAALWLPLLLLLELKFIEGKAKAWFFIPFIFFFIYTAGDFQVPFYITVTYVLFGIYLSFQNTNSIKTFFFFVAKVGLGLALGILLSLPQFLPTLELFASSIRVEDPYIKEYFFGIMEWNKVLNFLWPDFFGNVVTRNYWGGKFGYFHEYLAFSGTATLIFAVFSFFTKKIKSESFFWGLLLLSLIFLFPTPLAFLPYKLSIPGLGTSSASRIIFLVDFCLTTLAAYGFSKGIERKSLLRLVFYFLFISMGIALGVFISILLMQKAGSLEIPMLINLKVALKNMLPPTLVIIFLIVGLVFNKYIFGQRKVLPIFILLVTAAELLRFGWKNTPFSPREFVFPQTQIIKFLQGQTDAFRIAGGIPLNLFMPFGLSSVEGYDPIYPLRVSELFSLVNTGSFGTLTGRFGIIHDFASPLLDFANMRFVVDYRKNIYGNISENGEFARGLRGPRYKEVYEEGRIKVFENTHALPRVWLSTDYIVKEKKDLATSLTDLQTSQNRLIILESAPTLQIGDDMPVYQIEDFKQRANTVSFNVDTSTSSLVFVSQTYYPGWKAFACPAKPEGRSGVDGCKETKIHRANFAFRAIELPEGEHNIQFIYAPQSYKIGKWLSLATVFLLVALFIIGRRYERKESP